MDEKILSAARTLLANNGYEGMTYEAIGAMCGVGRPTIYRRWPSKVHLAAEVAYGSQENLPETGGNLRTQIHALVSQVAERYRLPEVGAATVALISSFQKDKALRAQLHTPAEEAARHQLQSIVARAKDRGVIDQAADADLLFDIIVGTLVFRLVFSSTERPTDLVEALTYHLCHALAPQQAPLDT
ncbi:TetR/AcrR family transcriptional regulator [Sphingobium aromaticivastans]|uniref:TetR/AcrR family transcriptional regulator n=1 Tax=Sphingobium aromaticivastans TaxID=1778665 RepID=UPI00301728B6